LIESQGDGLHWFASVPAAFSPARGTWQAVPLYHLFGSEENSSRAAPVQERIPQAYVALAKSEADRLGVNDGALLSLTVAGQALRLPLRITEELGAGLVGLPSGLAGIPPAFAGASVEGLQEAAQ
jgi:NADH-quinone oxidoreductase subunit G